MHEIATATTASPTLPEQAISASLTAEQVCDLPLNDLIAQVNARLDIIDTHAPNFAGIDCSGFFGYIVVRESGVTIYTPADATDVARDVYIRYLITQHLGLPTGLFPDVFEVTVFAGPNLDKVQA
ncbi:hypothetical protein SAMN05216532_3980 [Streptomyces sp. 2231.1]|uniref:hypothetical protein n=1 Tax=Streptomyces sp. 2231.1 TaxID=1855347 RepID=UPI00089965C3|nr:hypothetical protein [Streptomyces sp. 2231.1]SED26017.1 hypothetical protein SAMN05216532_3980 [Streptomyces sp. 2231.1]